MKFIPMPPVLEGVFPEPNSDEMSMARLLRQKEAEIERLKDMEQAYLEEVKLRLELEVEIERLREAIIRAPCSQNRIPCRWPCDNDPEDHGPCWKQAALAGEEPPQP